MPIRFLSKLAMGLVVAELLLMLISWIWSAAIPMSGVRSMLSGEGIRWFFGHFADIMATPLLVWLLLLAMSYGALVRSGLMASLRRTVSFRRRRARIITLFFVLIYVAAVLLLTVSPHAVLLSASGTLWPSPFSASLIPIIAFGLLSAAIVYGMVAGTFQTLSDVYRSLQEGICKSAPLLPLYVLLTQFYYSLLFCFA